MGRPRKVFISDEVERLREIRRKNAQAWYAAHKEQALEYQRQYYGKNKPRILAREKKHRQVTPYTDTKRAYNKKWHESNPEYKKAHGAQYRIKHAERLKQLAIDHHYRKAYGFDKARKMAMLAEQGGTCAICKRKPDVRSCVDHDHETGVVRGILCLNCNTALGHFRDDIATMEAAIAYIAKYSEVKAMAC